MGFFIFLFFGKTIIFMSDLEKNNLKKISTYLLSPQDMHTNYLLSNHGHIIIIMFYLVGLCFKFQISTFTKFILPSLTFAKF